MFHHSTAVPAGSCRLGSPRFSLSFPSAGGDFAVTRAFAFPFFFPLFAATLAAWDTAAEPRS